MHVLSRNEGSMRYLNELCEALICAALFSLPFVLYFASMK
jgi:hypothetical protein